VLLRCPKLKVKGLGWSPGFLFSRGIFPCLFYPKPTSSQVFLDPLSGIPPPKTGLPFSPTSSPDSRCSRQCFSSLLCVQSRHQPQSIHFSLFPEDVLLLLQQMPLDKTNPFFGTLDFVIFGLGQYFHLPPRSVHDVSPPQETVLSPQTFPVRQKNGFFILLFYLSLFSAVFRPPRNDLCHPSFFPLFFLLPFFPPTTLFLKLYRNNLDTLLPLPFP